MTEVYKTVHPLPAKKSTCRIKSLVPFIVVCQCQVPGFDHHSTVRCHGQKMGKGYMGTLCNVITTPGSKILFLSF